MLGDNNKKEKPLEILFWIYIEKNSNFKNINFFEIINKFKFQKI